MACFLPPYPLPISSFPRTHARIRPRKRIANHKPTASLKPPITPVSPSLPAQAAEILDLTAQDMLNNLSFTPIQTSLQPTPINTSHLTLRHCSSKPALVFLHGFDSNLLEFRRIHSVLSQNPPGRLHYLDILGWGFTERPHVNYGPADKREHLRSFIDHFEQRPVILIGASIGAAIAVDFALSYPERVSKLVLIDGQVFMDRPKAPIPKFLAALGAEVLRSRWLRQLAVEMTYEKAEFKCEDVLRISGLHCRMDRWKDTTIDFTMGPGYCLSNHVNKVRDKSFVIWGEHDRVLPRGHVERFREAGFPVAVARGCGHSPHIEDPDFVAEVIRAFATS